MDVSLGLRASRQAFPFLEMLARWAWRCKISPEELATAGKRKKSVTKSFGKKSKRKREAEAAAAAAAAAALEAAAVEEVEVAAGVGGEGAGELEGDGGEGSGDAAAGVSRGLRGRENTGVASLLVELAKADPSGDTIRSMQRWACVAILPEEVRYPDALRLP